MLDVKNLSVTLGGARILEDVSFTAREGQWLMILGPNGAGKSTIVNAISGGVPYAGEVRLDGENVHRMKPRVRARKLGVLSQNHHVSYAFTVEEIVRMGRYAHARGLFSPRSGEDEAHFLDAVEKTGLSGFLNQSVLTVSGGEMQRAFLAQLLCQDPRLMLLDEPTNHLDPKYQKQIFDLVRRWVAQSGRCVVSVVHDLSLARAYGTHALLLKDGRVCASGGIRAVLTDEHLRQVYDMDVCGWMRTLYEGWTEETT